MTTVTTSVQKLILLMRYIGQLEGLIEGSPIDKGRYSDLKETFDDEISRLNRELLDDIKSNALAKAAGEEANNEGF